MGACASRNDGDDEDGGLGRRRRGSGTPTKEGMDRALARLAESRGKALDVEEDEGRAAVTTDVTTAGDVTKPLKEEKREEGKTTAVEFESLRGGGGGGGGDRRPLTATTGSEPSGTVEARAGATREDKIDAVAAAAAAAAASASLSTEATVRTSPTTMTNAASSDASVVTNPSPSGRESLAEVERVEKEKETIRRRRVKGETLEETPTRRTSYDDATIADLRKALSETLPPSSLSAAASAKVAKNRTKSTSVRRRREERAGDDSTPPPSRLQSLMRERERARASGDYHDAEYDDGNRSDDDRAPARRKGDVVKKEDVERRVRKELRRQAREETSLRRRETVEEEDGEVGEHGGGGDDEDGGDVVGKQNLRVSLVERGGAKRRSDRGYHSQLDKLLAIAERAGSTAERVHSDITDLGARVNTVKAVHMQPWEERGNAWAGDRRSRNSKSNREDEKSSSAGTILNPKNKLSKEVRQAFAAKSDDACSSPRSSNEKPKFVTSVLRSDLLKSMGEMSADEKLERLGLKSVPEDDGSSDGGNGSSQQKSLHMSRSARSTPVSRRRDWQERTRRTPSLYSDEDEAGFTPPPPPAPSVHSNWDSVGTPSGTRHQSPMNYVDKLKAQAKLARAESARSWKVGVGVRNGASEL